ncbi:MAG TPA: hypothetical protein H9815_14095 [Candidatus Ruania gallistercoris]|uniref:DUF6199 domain-containing protein n=1 Tax=Candidatus Ruania gallistercoris TaxID=2838746 RepID=A0A9D2EFW5_9MICO|nr:hypothetical protein [Candidatus Ruania gallistercoris]
MTFVYIMLVVAAGLCLWGAISPMGMWRGTVAWRYADPEAHRPSDSQNTATRVASVIALICIIIAFPLLNALNEQGQQQRQEDAYEDCLDEQDDRESLLTPEEWCENLSPEPQE